VTAAPSLLKRMARPFAALSDHRSLTVELARRDILGRYRGASFGLLWSLISPFLMLMIYTFAFGTVMGGRWPQVEEGETSFSIILFAALIVHGFFSECLVKSPTLITANPNFVKRVIFPIDILPWPLVLSALFHTCTTLLVFLVLRLVMDGQVAWTTVFFPLVMLPLVVLCLAMSWFLAALGVYLRDITQVTPLLSLALLFLSTAMMPLASVPQDYRWIFMLNPLSFIIDQARAVLLWNELPDWQGLGIYLAVALALVYAARYFFATTRRGFADVL
jgi:lipopolysaccharide transport system permease protein